DAGIRALLGIRTALDDDGAIAWTGDAAPIARRIPAPPEGGGAVASVFEARNRLAGMALYEVPTVQARTPDGQPLDLPLRLAADQEVVLEARCDSGTLLTLDAPDLVGDVVTMGAAGGEGMAGAENPAGAEDP